MTAGVGDLTLVEAAAAVRDGRLSPVELVEHHLDVLERTEPHVRAFFTVTADQALHRARAAEAAAGARQRLGALHGIPLGVKDLVDTAGIRTTYGSPRFERHVPRRNATVVRRGALAGGVLVGKQATHELAWGGRTDSAHFGPTHNPHRRGHVPGGSSGGSAASVVVGSCLGAIGTDTAGSVRIPAALSGCVGFKPSRGRTSLTGVLPLAPSLDHVGVLARTVPDAAVLTDAVSEPGFPPLTPGPDPDAWGGLARSSRVGIATGWVDDVVDPAVAALAATSAGRLEQQGLRLDHAPLDGPAPAEAVLTQVLVEAWAQHRPAYDAAPEGFGADLVPLLAADPPGGRQLAEAQALVARAVADVLDALAVHDVLLLPTVPVTAPRIGELTLDVGPHRDLPVEPVLTRLTSIANAAGLPAVSVPVGTVDGLPVGMQVLGRYGEDRRVLAVASLLEAASPSLPLPEVR